MKSSSVCIFLFFLFAVSLSAQLPDSCKLRIGTNLAGPSDWGSEWPFVDIMKYCRSWITHNDHWVEGGQNEWDTKLLDSIPLDENGYPLELPVEVEGAEASQIVLTVWAGTQNLKGGIYTVLYDGEGVLDFWGDAEIKSQESGRMEVEIFPGIDSIFALEIRASEKGNHIRNIRMLMPGTEATYQEEPWTTEWLEKLAPFDVLRFMDWGKTNNSRLENWDDRPQIMDYTYTIDGLPYEWIIEICNLKKADAWICIPHRANENYIRQMAGLFRDQLDPSLKIYVEYSNEIWNWIFEQTHYCFENGNTNVDWPERIVPFIQNALDTWTEEFNGQSDRLIRVVGVQHAWQDVSNRIVFNMRYGSFDVFSPAAYFGFTDEGIEELEQLGPDATAEDVIHLARDGLIEDSYVWTKNQFSSIADSLDIPMIYYEGGQHLTPAPFGSVQAYNEALVAAQTHPEIYDLYNEWFDSLRTFVTEDKPALFMNFSFISPPSRRYGSWGALESQFYQFPPYQTTAPKYHALLDNIFNCEIATSSEVLPDVDGFVKLFPNPASQKMTVKTGEPIRQVEIIDITGKLLKRIKVEYSRQVDVSLNDLQSGLYFVKTEIEGTVFLSKIMIIKK